MSGVWKTLFSAGFRAFFPAAGAVAIVAMAIWSLWLLAGIAPPGQALPSLWHAHEMIFGYAAAAIAGFVLTAVPEWTGAPQASPAFVAAAVAIWAAGRIAVGISGALDPVPVALLDLAFLPMIAGKAVQQLVRKARPANLMIVGLLAIIWLGNLLMHLGWIGIMDDGAARGARVGLFGVASLIAVIGGRVTPNFTRNAMQRAGVETRPPVSRRPVEIAGIAAAIALPLLIAIGAGDVIVGTVAIAAGAAQTLRLAGWRPLWALGAPLLWSLHAGFAWLCLGYLATGLGYLGLVGDAVGLHLVGIGAVGGMTLAVMTRAILGHSGRALVASRRMVAAYLLVGLAAVARALAEVVPAIRYDDLLAVSAALWIGAFLVYLIDIWPLAARPRPKPSDEGAS